MRTEKWSEEGWRENLYLLILWTDGIFHHIKWLTTWHFCLRQVHSVSLATKKKNEEELSSFFRVCSLNCCWCYNNDDDADENVCGYKCRIHAWKMCHICMRKSGKLKEVSRMEKVFTIIIISFQYPKSLTLPLWLFVWFQKQSNVRLLISFVHNWRICHSIKIIKMCIMKKLPCMDRQRYKNVTDKWKCKIEVKHNIYVK